MFKSRVRELGEIEFPEFTGIRIMMMPVVLEDIKNTIPENIKIWEEGLNQLLSFSQVKKGIGYLTIDEKIVEPNTTQRRPGLHVDGIADNNNLGGWASNPGVWGRCGMLLGSNIGGCKAWDQDFIGTPKENGNCEDLISELLDDCSFDMKPKTIYWLSPMTVHQSLSFDKKVTRQFIRLSMPSDAGWYEGYTENPLGIKPTGPILPPRPKEFMEGKN